MNRNYKYIYLLSCEDSLNINYLSKFNSLFYKDKGVGNEKDSSV